MQQRKKFNSKFRILNFMPGSIIEKRLFKYSYFFLIYKTFLNKKRLTPWTEIVFLMMMLNNRFRFNNFGIKVR